MNVNVLDKMSDLTMRLGAMSVLMDLLVRGQEKLECGKAEAVMYFVNENLNMMHESAKEIGEDIDELLMNLKRQ